MPLPIPNKATLSFFVRCLASAANATVRGKLADPQLPMLPNDEKLRLGSRLMVLNNKLSCALPT